VCPHFKVNKIVTDSEGTRLIGTLNTIKYGRERWIDEDWIGYLRVDSVFIKGRWNRIGELWAFSISNHIDAERIKGQFVFDVFHGYWGGRAEIALNEDRQWERTVFQTVGNCDHYHCEICSAKIWERENREYMHSNDNLNICLSCYERAVVPHSLEFIRFFEEPNNIP
jgi:hypothetical protein